MNRRYRVDVSEAEQAELKSLVNGGKHPAPQGQARANPAGRARR